MGLHLDTNEVYTVNQAKTGQTWKNGVIINTGSILTIHIFIAILLVRCVVYFL